MNRSTIILFLFVSTYLAGALTKPLHDYFGLYAQLILLPLSILAGLTLARLYEEK